MIILVVIAWLVSLIAILVMPYRNHSPTLGDDLTRNTIRLALAYYALAASLMLTLRSQDWSARTGQWPLARWCWTLAWAAYVVHLGMAFHHYHHWSHAHAVAHTRALSGVGEGIYISHFFTLVWTADVVYWWLAPRRYADRSPWIARLLHAFMLFVIFNATVVYEKGPIRWAGLLLGAELLALYVCRFIRATRRRED